MRHPLQRDYGQGDLHFLTFSCYRRKPLLGTARARDRFVKVLDEIRCQHEFRLVGYVVMLEHVHLLLSEPPKKIRRRFCRCCRFHSRGAQKIRGVFGSGGFTISMSSARGSSKRKLEYMHANPVQRKLVQHPKDWPWSSWAHYAGRGEQHSD